MSAEGKLSVYTERVGAMLTVTGAREVVKVTYAEVTNEVASQLVLS